MRQEKFKTISSLYVLNFGTKCLKKSGKKAILSLYLKCSYQND